MIHVTGNFRVRKWKATPPSSNIHQLHVSVCRSKTPSSIFYFLLTNPISVITAVLPTYFDFLDSFWSSEKNVLCNTWSPCDMLEWWCRSMTLLSRWDNDIRLCLTTVVVDMLLSNCNTLASKARCNVYGNGLTGMGPRWDMRPVSLVLWGILWTVKRKGQSIAANLIDWYQVKKSAVMSELELILNAFVLLSHEWIEQRKKEEEKEN